ncbi:MAG: nuclear transport factor 2 family protein [Candidatus Acidiferrales bacterium]
MKTKLVESARARRLVGILTAVLLLAASAHPAAGQKNKNKNSKIKYNDQTDPKAPPMPAGPDSDQIDRDIGQMLAAFQIGDVELMHKYYADNVTFVSGAYEPPISGWQNYVPLYQQQRAAFQGMQLIRRNTIVFPHGDVAWAMYQWEFDSMLNGRPYSMRGQTTLIFNKVGGNWLIVHNHTSELSATPGPAQPPAAPQQTPAPAKP